MKEASLFKLIFCLKTSKDYSKVLKSRAIYLLSYNIGPTNPKAYFNIYINVMALTSLLKSSKICIFSYSFENEADNRYMVSIPK